MPEICIFFLKGIVQVRENRWENEIRGKAPSEIAVLKI